MSTMERQIEAISIAVTKALNKLGLSIIKKHPFFGMKKKTKWRKGKRRNMDRELTTNIKEILIT